jgi:dynein light chain roadblock-type
MYISIMRWILYNSNNSIVSITAADTFKVLDALKVVKVHLINKTAAGMCSTFRFLNRFSLKSLAGFSVLWKMSSSNTTASHAGEILDRIQHHKGVRGVIVVNSDSMSVRSTMDNSATVQYISMAKTLTTMARSVVRDINPQDDLTILRVRTKKNEIIIAPERTADDREYQVIAIQDYN